MGFKLNGYLTEESIYGRVCPECGKKCHYTINEICKECFCK